jgi:hypothetical protein
MLPSDTSHNSLPSPPKKLPESKEKVFQPQHERCQKKMNQILDINIFKIKYTFYFGSFSEMWQRRSEFSWQVKSTGSQQRIQNIILKHPVLCS